MRRCSAFNWPTQSTLNDVLDVAVGGDVAEPGLISGLGGGGNLSEEDEAFLSDAVDDGADLAVPEDSANDSEINQ